MNMTQTYLTLPLADIAKAVGLDGPEAVEDAEREVLRLVEDGDVLATVSQADGGGMVTFHDSPEMYDNAATMTVLDEGLRMAMETSAK